MALIERPQDEPSVEPVRIAIAIMVGCLPIAGYFVWGWTFQLVAFFYWLDLLLAGAYGAIVTWRWAESQWGKNTTWPQLLLLVVITMLPAALIAGAAFKFSGGHSIDVLQWLWNSFESARARWLLLLQILLRLGEAWFMPFRLGKSDAAAQAMLMQMVNRFCVIAMAFAPAILILTFASGSLSASGFEIVSSVILLFLATVWTLSDAFPSRFGQFVHWILK